MNRLFDKFSIRLIEEDNGEWTAYLIDLPNVSAIGDSPEQALSELKTAWEAMKESYRKHGEEIPKPKEEK